MLLLLLSAGVGRLMYQRYAKCRASLSRKEDSFYKESRFEYVLMYNRGLLK